MLDIKRIRENFDEVAEGLRRRGAAPELAERARDLDAERRRLVTEADGLKTLRNSRSKEIGALKKAGQDTYDRLIASSTSLDSQAAIPLLERDGFTNVTSWYAEPIVFEKVVLYTMLFEVVGRPRDAFLGALSPLALEMGMLMVLTSDHGNIEALNLRSHTFNPVPLIVVGEGGDALKRNVSNLVEVTPQVLRVLNQA